jgi:hypothetical protein
MENSIHLLLEQELVVEILDLLLGHMMIMAKE